MIWQITSGVNRAGVPQRGASLRRAARRTAPHPATGIASDRLSCAIDPGAAPSPQRPGRLPPARRSALVPPVSVALNALAPDRLVPVRAQLTVAPLKPCEPARYPPLQVERMLLTATRFMPMADLGRDHVLGATVANATRFAGAAPTESTIPTRCTSRHQTVLHASGDLP